MRIFFSRVNNVKMTTDGLPFSRFMKLSVCFLCFYFIVFLKYDYCPLTSQPPPPVFGSLLSYDAPTRELQCLGVNGERRAPLTSGIDCILENRSIFFVESDPSFVEFNGRKLCAFESTARHNPNTTEIIVLSHKHSIPQANIPFLTAIPNLYTTRINYEQTIKSSSVKKVWGSLKWSWRYFTVQTSDVIRLLLLSKFGGAYFDSDVVSLAAMPQDLQNFVIKDVKDEEDLNNGIIHFCKNNPFLLKILSELTNAPSGQYTSFGPALLRQTFSRHCPKSQWKRTNDTRVKYVCPGGTAVLEKYLAHRWDTADYSEPNKTRLDVLLSGVKDSFAAHYFGSKFDAGTLKLKLSSPLVGIMESHCPNASLIVKKEI